MSCCLRCGESRANPACPVCRRLEPDWEDPPESVTFDTVLLMIGIVLVVATVLYFVLKLIELLVR